MDARRDVRQLDWWIGGSNNKWRGNYNSVNGWCG
jgi:hypothetical protein